MGQQTRRKPVRVMEQYGLKHLADALEERWTREENRYTIRELAGWFNTRLVEKRMRDVGMDPLEGEAENVYRLLSDPDVPEYKQQKAVQKLEGNGIDVAALHTDFVSYSSIYGLLTEEREVEFEDNSTETRVDRSRERLRRLRERSANVTHKTMDTLANAGEIPEPPPEIHVSFRVECPFCGLHRPADEYIKQGGCRCQRAPTEADST